MVQLLVEQGRQLTAGEHATALTQHCQQAVPGRLLVGGEGVVADRDPVGVRQ